LTIATVVLAVATIQLKNTTEKYAKTAEEMLESNIKHTDIVNDMLNEQRTTMRKERLLKEMDLLVAPLFSVKGDGTLFQKGEESRNNSDPLVHKYYDFWDGIKQNAYLGSSDLREKLDNYFKNKSPVRESPDPAFTKARDELWSTIQKRYDELNEELSKLENH
ncbi:MAG: hypothetical protein IBX39_08445, partial [Candidatus Methanoperedenaceae archaeon]|nr:hypothetical protein [Candidatus Methanoperedenaceae archaeon]